MLHVRDLILRYWDLNRRDRYELMSSLDIEIVGDKEREALVEVAKQDRLLEFQSKLELMEER